MALFFGIMRKYVCKMKIEHKHVRFKAAETEQIKL